METINRGGGQLEQRLPCCGLRAGERDWEAVPLLFFVALSKVVICVPVLICTCFLLWCVKETHTKKALLAFNASCS